MGGAIEGSQEEQRNSNKEWKGDSLSLGVIRTPTIVITTHDDKVAEVIPSWSKAIQWNSYRLEIINNLTLPQSGDDE